MPRTNPTRKSRARRQRNRRARRNNSNVPDKASCSVKLDISPGTQPHFSNNTMYSITGISLSQFARASTVSKGYQMYRIKSFKLTIRSSFDTYDSTAGVSKPDLYYQIDKAGVLSPTTATWYQLKQMGARPRALDEKPLVITFTPAVLSEMEGGPGALASAYKVSPWLSTNTDNVLHRGVFWFVSQVFGTALSYQCEMEAQFEFKKPVWGSPSQADPNPPDIAVPKGSVDYSSILPPTSGA